jgi:hypothetical protein
LAEECLIQDIAAGTIQPHEIIDPLHFDPERLAELLRGVCWTVTPPPVEDRTEAVSGPSFLKDPVRASGSQFTSAPPAPRDELVEMVRGWVEQGSEIHLYAPPGRKLTGGEAHWYGQNSERLYEDLRTRQIDAYSVKQDLLAITPEYRPQYLGYIQYNSK